MFYYSRNGQQFGPHSEQELRSFIGQGSLTSGDLVWKEGMAAWAPAHTVLASLPPPPPPPPQAAPFPPQQAAPYPPPQFGGAGGYAQQPHYPPQPHAPQYGAPAAYAPPGGKTRIAYILLGVFLGGFGVHNFYAGYTGRAVAQLVLTLIGLFTFFPLIAVGIWALVEVITVTHDANGVRLA